MLSSTLSGIFSTRTLRRLWHILPFQPRSHLHLSFFLPFLIASINWPLMHFFLIIFWKFSFFGFVTPPAWYLPFWIWFSCGKIYHASHCCKSRNTPVRIVESFHWYTFLDHKFLISNNLNKEFTYFYISYMTLQAVGFFFQALKFNNDCIVHFTNSIKNRRTPTLVESHQALKTSRDWNWSVGTTGTAVINWTQNGNIFAT